MKRKIICFIISFLFAFSIPFQSGCKKQTAKSLNLVVTVEFEDTQGFFKEEQSSILNRAFITDKNGLKNFILKNSNCKKTVETVFTQTVKIDKSVNYFMPRYFYDIFSEEYQEVNPDGYDNRLYDDLGVVDLNGKPSSERFFREQDLLYAVTSGVDEKSLPLSKDYEFENLTVVFSKLNVGLNQSDVFWPHQAKVYTGDKEGLSSVYSLGQTDATVKEIKLGDRSINSYIFIPYAFISDGENLKTTTLCHEYMHALGAPDLYRNGAKEFVGEFDIMGGTETDVPNLSLSYVRYKLGWISELSHVEPISKSGEYVLYPTENYGGTLAYKITLPEFAEKGESFYIEYRKLGEGSRANTQTEGVIVYRVNEDNGYLNSKGENGSSWRGNAYFEEVSVFTFWRELLNGDVEERDEITSMGTCYATIFDKAGYTSYGSAVEGEKVNAITYSDGTNSKITVEYLGATENGGIKVKIGLPEIKFATKINEGIVAKNGNRHVLTFDSDHYGKTAYVLYSEKRILNPKAEKLAKPKVNGKNVVKLRTEFLQTTLPKFDGIEKYVYVFYGDENGFTAVKEYKIAGIKNLNVTAVIVIAIGVGVALPTGTLYIIKRISKRRKENGK
ncbi:MAG: hypothetical protein IJW64_03640 [Clostridia bacterium]|nr:hypothetical protein [Clostridia bacterium]